MSTTNSTSSTSASSTSSVTSTLISALGGGSGVNMSALAEQLSVAQFAARVDTLNSKNDRLSTEISAASTLKSMVASLAASMGERVRTGDLAVKPVIANTAVASVSKGAASGSGTTTLEVTAIAKGQTITSPILPAATSTVGAGTLTLRFGTISGGSFTADASRAAVPITVAADDTLQDVAAAINRSGAGVAAYVATGANGAQLVLKGADGAANAFQLEASEDADNPGLSTLAWTPADTARLKSAASDATYFLDGVERTSTSNIIENAAPGLTLKLTGTNTGLPTTISYSDPSNAITTAMDDLTGALNEMISELNTDTAAQSGALANDPGARALRRTLNALTSTVVMPGTAEGVPATLGDIGLKTNRDGTFALDTDKLAKVLKEQPDAVAAMFTNGLYGVYATMDKISRAVSISTDPNSLGGTIATKTKLKTSVSTQLTDIADKQETLRVNLVSRYSKLNTQLTASQSTLSFLKAQIDAWNAKSN